MSAIHGLNPAPVRTPEPLAPAAPPPAPVRSSSLRVWVLLALVAGGVWAAYQLVAKQKAQTKTPQTAGIRTAKVTTGAIQRVLRLTGATSAKNFAMIAAPMMRGPEGSRALDLIYLTKSGAVVKKGDVVARIDMQSTQD